MPIREELKAILAIENMTITKLAQLASAKSKQKITANSISEKLIRGTIKYEEARLLIETLGYKIKFEKMK